MAGFLLLALLLLSCGTQPSSPSEPTPFSTVTPIVEPGAPPRTTATNVPPAATTLSASPAPQDETVPPLAESGITPTAVAAGKPFPVPGTDVSKFALSPAEIAGLVHPGVKGAIEDLYRTEGVDKGSLRVAIAERVTWPDAGLGCGEPGMFYAQVLTPGIWLVFHSQEHMFDYRISGEGWTICSSTEGGEPLTRQPLGGLWSNLAPVPTPRSEVAVAELNGKVYVFGGFGRGATANEEYDPANDSWRQRAPIPRGVDHPAVAALGGKIFLIAGFDGRFRPVDRVWAYDPETDTWTQKSDLPTPRGALGAAVVEGKIYAIGGVAVSGDVGTTEVYDPLTDAWSPRSPMATPRDHLAVSVVEGNIYAIGGRLGGYANNLGAAEVYNPETDRWTAIADLPTVRSGIASTTVQGQIYVFGGESTEGAFDTNERYGPATDSWESMPPLPTARHGLGAVALNDRIYVIAGGPTPGGSRSSRNEVFIVLGPKGP